MFAQPGDTPHPRISVSLICKFLYLRLTMFSPVRSVHFTGIGGTAMASAAAAMQDKGFAVTGSDQNVYPPMSTFLAGKQIEVMNGYAERNLAHRPDLVVIGNAISRGNPEAEFVLDHKLRYCSLPELLKEFFIRGKRSIVVAGTHGKTTTTALLAWVFEHNGLNPSFLLGGIPNNLGQGARFTDPINREQARMVHHRGRRIRHGVFRQAQQVRPLPAGNRHHQQPRVRSRGHF